VTTYSCTTPVAKISVSPLKCQTSQCQVQNAGNGNIAALISLARQQNGQKDLSNLDEAMTTMLVSSLSGSGCFDVLDRQAMEEMKREMAFAGKEMQIEAADYLITGSLTTLDYKKTKSVVGGGFIPLAGMFANTKTTAKIGMDVRLMNVNTSKIEYTKTYKSSASNDNYSFGAIGAAPGGVAGGGMSFGGDLELERSVRKVLNQSVADLIKSAAAGRYEVKTERVSVK
jgi:curli biogenesis system outer membrane secretion channel CsgG